MPPVSLIGSALPFFKLARQPRQSAHARDASKTLRPTRVSNETATTPHTPKNTTQELPSRHQFLIRSINNMTILSVSIPDDVATNIRSGLYQNALAETKRDIPKWRSHSESESAELKTKMWKILSVMSPEEVVKLRDQVRSFRKQQH